MEVIKIFVTGRYAKQVELVNQYLKRSTESPFVVSNSIPDCNVYVTFDLIVDRDLSLNKNMKTILIRHEPEIVLPQNYSQRNTKKFTMIIDIGKQLNSRTTVINWPQILSYQNSLNQIKQKKFIIVNSDKLSLIKGENYSLRRLVIKEIAELDCYGFDWNQKFIEKLKIFINEFMKVRHKPYLLKLSGLRYYFRRNKNWLGNIDNKNQILSKYKFNVVIENSNDYVSEKLFDSFNAGCIPIYVGPNLSNYQFPTNLYVQAEPSVTSIKIAMKKVEIMDYETWKCHLLAWLNSPKTHEMWSEELFISKILSRIQYIL